MPAISPAISVVMPVYNRADSVGRAVQSVLAQDFEDFELIVVDDGSTDGTPEAVEACGDPRVRCLRQPTNMGGNAARNRGIREARAPLVAFIDSDDAYLPHKLGFLVRYFDENHQVDALVDSFRLDYPPEKGTPPASRTNPVLETSREVEEAVFARRLYKSTPAFCVRREALMKVGLFDETLKRRQDMDLILRLCRSVNCASTDQVLWVKQWSADSISAKQETFATAVIEMCERHPDYLTRRAFRIGLARDVARHFLRLVAQGKLGAAARDFRRCAAFFGGATFARLWGAGLWEMGRRLVTRREV